MQYVYLGNTKTSNSETCKKIFPELSSSVVSAPSKNRKNDPQNWKEECGARLICERGKLMFIVGDGFAHRICNHTPWTRGLRSVKHPLRPYVLRLLLNVNLHVQILGYAGFHSWRSHVEVFGRTLSREKTGRLHSHVMWLTCELQSIGYATLAHLDPQYGLCKPLFFFHSFWGFFFNKFRNWYWLIY